MYVSHHTQAIGASPGTHETRRGLEAGGRHKKEGCMTKGDQRKYIEGREGKTGDATTT
jgi:hypothetical protein